MELTSMFSGDDLAGALYMLIRQSWCLLMRLVNLFTKCTGTAWLGEMAAAEACLLCIGVEFRMLSMCMAGMYLGRIQCHSHDTTIDPSHCPQAGEERWACVGCQVHDGHS